MPLLAVGHGCQHGARLPLLFSCEGLAVELPLGSLDLVHVVMPCSSALLLPLVPL